MPFVKKHKPTEAATLAELSSTAVRDPAKDLKYCQLQSRKSRKRVEEISCQLDDARQERERVSREAVADDQLDVAAIGALMTASHQKVLGLEAALSVALRQDEEAGEQLKLADVESRREVLRKHLVQLGIQGHKVQATMDGLTAQIAEMTPWLNAVRGLGFDSINQELNNASLLFKPKLLTACRLMPNCAVTEAWFLKNEPWVESLPKPDQAFQAK